LKNKDQSNLTKDLNKQYDQLLMESILQDKSKNIVKDQDVNNFKIRFQKVLELPFKDLRKLIDRGKKDLGEGIIVVYAIKDNKIGLAIGVTKSLTSKLDAVKLVKIGSEIIGGKGGGGRSDFAQAGGIIINKIEESFEKIKSLIN
jgi:alanyl-tRNA synthetase